MELKKAILERRSIRAFSEKPVEKNLLKEKHMMPFMLEA